MAISVERIRADIEAIARCTETPGKGATRPTFSRAWSEARAYVIAQAEAAGCDVRTDAAGNVHARPKALGWNERAWLVGSHIDSVPHGGDYDGVAGVVAGLELLRSRREHGIDAVPVELIVFAEEEGPTFGLGMLGSRAWVGELVAGQFGDLRNQTGQTYLEAGKPFGVDPSRLEGDRFRSEHYLGLIEVHIEQGPGMWRRDQPLAVVTAIAGRRQAHVIVRGEANHAGATAMSDRKDALAGAAACILGLEMFVRDLGKGAVLTVGRIENHPNAVNVVPDRVEFTIDFRCGDTPTVETALFPMRGLIEDTCRRRGLTCDVLTSECIPARPMDAKLVEAISAIGGGGGGLPTTVSGALHDSAVLAPHLPTVMLFVPSKDGISHNPAEFSRVEDIAAAAQVVERLVRRESMRALNEMTLEGFVSVCGRFYEHSPRIPERASLKRPIATIGQLHELMSGVVRAASTDEKLGLIRAHPDFVGRMAREGRLTRESTLEQAAAGLDSLSDDEITGFERHNAAYRERFGFPFVICARENRKDAILAAFPKRLANSREQEIATALAEIDKIARLRMNDAIWED
jgi:allantoate deiminase